MSKFYDALLEVLQQDERYFTQDGTLLRNVVYDAAMKKDQSLISALYANKETRERFFTDRIDIDEGGSQSSSSTRLNLVG